MGRGWQQNGREGVQVTFYPYKKGRGVGKSLSHPEVGAQDGFEVVLTQDNAAIYIKKRGGGKTSLPVLRRGRK